MKKIIWVNLILFYFFNQIISQQNDSLKFDLPELLVSNDGTKIITANDWENKRRNEVLELFENYEYGKVPANNIKVKFNIKKEIKNALCGKAVLKEVEAVFFNDSDSLEMTILIFLPKLNKPVPIFLGMNFYGNHTIHCDTNISITDSYVPNNIEFCIFNNKADHLSRGVRSSRWPVERILERGYGLATIYYGDVDPDFDDGFQNGIHKLFYSNKDKSLKDNEWGSISAWAYGLSKAMDYIETDKNIDKNKVIVFGHSRLGKTALWAGAKDQRFAMVISNNSGCGGAALSKRIFGEKLSDINSNFPHWFCKTFHNYNGKEENLPFDQNMLIALIAPRPIYVASAEKDLWADPYGEYLSLYYSAPVYKLYKEEVFDSIKIPELNEPKLTGKFAYHIRGGGHDITKYDWEQYLNFADKHLK